MKFKRRFISEARGNKKLQKCLALILVLRSKLKNSKIYHYNTNKFRKLARISYKTAEKYEILLQERNLIHFEGTENNRVLVINKISSRTNNRNIIIDEMDFSSYFSAYRSLQAFIFMRIQHNKDFYRHLLQARHNPKNPKEYRIAKKQVKNLVKQGKLESVNVQYKEYGLSLDRIAKEVGCCIRTVQRVVSYAIRKKWVEKEQHYEWIEVPFINFAEVDEVTFTTRHHLCIVHPNTYTLSPKISATMSLGTWYYN